VVLTGQRRHCDRRAGCRPQDQGAAYYPDAEFRNRVLVAGCDPGISVLARHVLLAGVELVPALRNSSQALLLLKQGRVHIAGTHLRDEVTGESNIPESRACFPKSGGRVFRLPCGRKVFSRLGEIRRESAESKIWAARMSRSSTGNRERQPFPAGLPLAAPEDRCPVRVRLSTSGSGHLPAAWQVRTGAADAVSQHAPRRDCLDWVLYR